jgi:hypothetical protein
LRRPTGPLDGINPEVRYGSAMRHAYLEDVSARTPIGSAGAAVQDAGDRSRAGPGGAPNATLARILPCQYAKINFALSILMCSLLVTVPLLRLNT